MTRMVVLTLVCFIAPCMLLQAQDTAQVNKANYRLELYASGGPQMSWFRDRRTPFSANTGAAGTNLMMRMMWHPDHILSVGLLSGWTSISTERLYVSNTNGQEQILDAHLSAIPMQIDFGIQKWGFELGVGIGAYWLFSDLGREGGVLSTSSQIESGVSALFAYTFMLTDDFGIGPELNVHALSYRGITSASALLRIRYDLHKY